MSGSAVTSHRFLNLFVAAISSHYCTLSYFWWSEPSVRYHIPAHEVDRVLAEVLEKHGCSCCGVSEAAEATETTTTTTLGETSFSPRLLDGWWFGIACGFSGVLAVQVLGRLLHRCLQLLTAQARSLT